GMLLGVYYIHKRDLWFPIMLHLTWNFFQGPVFGFKVSGIAGDKSMLNQQLNGPIWLTGGEFGFEGSLLLTILLIIAIIIIHYSYKDNVEGVAER
ncbi:MAG: CPBP family intramembrane glutamate endopeptidase, partial [Flavobacteriales bacterium]